MNLFYLCFLPIRRLPSCGTSTLLFLELCSVGYPCLWWAWWLTRECGLCLHLLLSLFCFTLSYHTKSYDSLSMSFRCSMSLLVEVWHTLELCPQQGKVLLLYCKYCIHTLPTYWANSKHSCLITACSGIILSIEQHSGNSPISLMACPCTWSAMYLYTEIDIHAMSYLHTNVQTHQAA